MSRRSRSRLAADWFAKLRVNSVTQEVEHDDVLAEQAALDATEAAIVAAKVVADSEMATAVSNAGFPSGTTMPFYQLSAPTGWTKVVTAALNAAGIRIVTTTAWTAGATGTADPYATHSHTVAAHAHTTGSKALTLANMKSHRHSTYFLTSMSTSWGSGGRLSQGANTGGSYYKYSSYVGSTSAHNHGNTGTQAAVNTGANTTPKYINMIIATKA